MYLKSFECWFCVGFTVRYNERNVKICSWSWSQNEL